MVAEEDVLLLTNFRTDWKLRDQEVVQISQCPNFALLMPTSVNSMLIVILG